MSAIGWKADISEFSESTLGVTTLAETGDPMLDGINREQRYAQP
jgi:hypothetical protein